MGRLGYFKQLLTELKSLTKSVADKVGQAKAQLQGLPASVKTSESIDLTQQAINSLSRAKQAQTISADLEDQAWAEALRAAIAAYGDVAKQADEALSSIGADRDTYNKLQQDVEKAMDEARTTIQRVEIAVKHRDAGSASKEALNRAKATLPRPPDKDASIGTLQSTLKKARETRTAAERAEELAQRAILAAKAKREQQATTWRPSAGGSWTSSPSWSSHSKSSRSASRPSSGSTSSGSRSTSVSHRASSTSSSKRRSSMGSSRRR